MRILCIGLSAVLIALHLCRPHCEQPRARAEACLVPFEPSQRKRVVSLRLFCYLAHADVRQNAYRLDLCRRYPVARISKMTGRHLRDRSGPPQVLERDGVAPKPRHARRHPTSPARVGLTRGVCGRASTSLSSKSSTRLRATPARSISFATTPRRRLLKGQGHLMHTSGGAGSGARGFLRGGTLVRVRSIPHQTACSATRRRPRGSGFFPARIGSALPPARRHRAFA